MTASYKLSRTGTPNFGFKEFENRSDASRMVHRSVRGLLDGIPTGNLRNHLYNATTPFSDRKAKILYPIYDLSGDHVPAQPMVRVYLGERVGRRAEVWLRKDGLGACG